MGEISEGFCKICGGAHPTGACQEIITKTGLTREELEKGVKTEDGEKIFWINSEEFKLIEKIKNPYLLATALEKAGISDNGIFDTEVNGDRIRYRYDKQLGLIELSRTEGILQKLEEKAKSSD